MFVLSTENNLVNAAVFRALRYLIHSEKVYVLSMTFNFEYYVQKTFLCEPSCDVLEKQAIKYIRHLCSFKEVLSVVPAEIFAILRSKAEENEDKMRNIVLETICEICILFSKLQVFST